MKTNFFTLVMLASISLIIGCDKTAEDEFKDANENIEEKLIKNFQSFDEYGSENHTVNYGSDNKVSSITNNKSNVFLNYNESNNLKTIVNDEEIFNIDELYNSPYETFETGNVLEYDDNGNPMIIEFFEDGEDSDIFTAEIIYDPNPNPFFHTLKAAGIIDVLNRVDLRFGTSNQALIKAKLLLPYNNIRAMIFKNILDHTVCEVQIDSNYDADKYPTTSNVTILFEDETISYTLVYTYK